MNIEEVRTCCLSLPGVTEDMPYEPAWHMNKKYWNDIIIENTFPDESIEGWIRESFDLVKSMLPMRLKEKLTEASEFGAT